MLSKALLVLMILVFSQGSQANAAAKEVVLEGSLTLREQKYSIPVRIRLQIEKNKSSKVSYHGLAEINDSHTSNLHSVTYFDINRKNGKVSSHISYARSYLKLRGEASSLDVGQALTLSVEQYSKTEKCDYLGQGVKEPCGIDNGVLNLSVTSAR